MGFDEEGSSSDCFLFKLFTDLAKQIEHSRNGKNMIPK